MKEYKKFLSDQFELTEKLQTLSNTKPVAGSGVDAKDTIASTRGVSVKIEPSDINLIKSLDNRAVYNFTSFLQNFADLSNMVISAEQAEGYKQALDRMNDSDPRKLRLMQEIENAMLMPKSADRTTKVSNILTTINSIAMEMGQNSLSYDQVQPETFRPDMTNRTFGRRG